MKILLYGNCQMTGIEYFMRRSPDHQAIETRVVQDFQVELGEVTKPHEKSSVEWADTIIYHSRANQFPWDHAARFRDDCKLIKASVFYNGGYYLSQAKEVEDWLSVMGYAKRHGIDAAIRYAVHEADVGYWRRRLANLRHMMEKEQNEEVPPSTRMSDFVAQGIEQEQHITMNHPTSIVFVEWADRLLKHLGFQGVGAEQREAARCNKNLVGLPCEDYVPTSARKHLGLKWGGSDYDNQMCEGIAKQWLRGHALSAEYSLG